VVALIVLMAFCLSSGRSCALLAPRRNLAGLVNLPLQSATRRRAVAIRTTKNVLHSRKIFHLTGPRLTQRHQALGDVDHQSACEESSSSACCARGSEPQNWLVVGDGDLSYSANLARELMAGGGATTTTSTTSRVRLVASVLEDEETHNKVYRNSRKNTEIIRRSSGSTLSQDDKAKAAVLFSVDATQLEHRFPSQSFDRITFNFPHWRGKTNNRYNRQLLDSFLQSAAKVLNRNRESEIHIALCDKQGGADATNLVEWRTSWMAQAYAAEHGLVLRRLEPFFRHQKTTTSAYDLSSHRGVDRPFLVGDQPLTYVFGWPVVGSSSSEDNDDDARINGNRHSASISTSTEEEEDLRLSLAFRHELRLVLDPTKLASCPHSQHELEHSSVVPELVRQVTPGGVHCEVPLRSVILPKKTAFPLLVFLVVYRSGVQRPLTRSMADAIRNELEEAATARFGLELAKRDRMVSKPFPYRILDTLIEDR